MEMETLEGEAWLEEAGDWGHAFNGYLCFPALPYGHSPVATR